jgi:hypothetical protein
MNNFKAIIYAAGAVDFTDLSLADAQNRAAAILAAILEAAPNYLAVNSDIMNALNTINEGKKRHTAATRAAAVVVAEFVAKCKDEEAKAAATAKADALQVFIASDSEGAKRYNELTALVDEFVADCNTLAETNDAEEVKKLAARIEKNMDAIGKLGGYGYEDTWGLNAAEYNYANDVLWGNAAAKAKNGIINGYIHQAQVGKILRAAIERVGGKLGSFSIHTPEGWDVVKFNGGHVAGFLPNIGNSETITEQVTATAADTTPVLSPENLALINRIAKIISPCRWGDNFNERRAAAQQIAKELRLRFELRLDRRSPDGYEISASLSFYASNDVEAVKIYNGLAFFANTHDRDTMIRYWDQRLGDIEALLSFLDFCLATAGKNTATEPQDEPAEPQCKHQAEPAEPKYIWINPEMKKRKKLKSLLSADYVQPYSKFLVSISRGHFADEVITKVSELSQSGLIELWTCQNQAPENYAAAAKYAAPIFGLPDYCSPEFDFLFLHYLLASGLDEKVFEYVEAPKLEIDTDSQIKGAEQMAKIFNEYFGDGMPIPDMPQWISDEFADLPF